jgi:hypothetical protein
MNLRCLTNEGVHEFSKFLQLIKQKPSHSPLMDIFNNSPYSDKYSYELEIDEKIKFHSRYEMGKYLANIFKEITDNNNIIPSGVWDWVSVIWFDNICPLVNGSRKVLENARYIVSDDRTDRQRHYIHYAWRLYTMYPEYSKLLLASPPYQHSDIAEQLASTEEIITNHSLIKTAYYLYWDHKIKQPKKYAANRNKPGNIRRFISIVSQLALTYDLYAMTDSEIISLLPQEFDNWKK